MQAERWIGIDIGAETAKLAELSLEQGALRWTRRALVEHHKDPASLLPVFSEWELENTLGVAACGRLSRAFALPRLPDKVARALGFRFLKDHEPATLVSIGAHGFSVLELRASANEVYRENSRCSQGTGNFLRQLVERFGLGLEEACALSDKVDDPAPLSGRCPVILKTDLTHLANHGQSHARLIAGLFDAVAENVEVLLKPKLSPPRVALLGGVSRSARVRRHFTRFLARNGMQLLELDTDEALFCDAIGAARHAYDAKTRFDNSRPLLPQREQQRFELLPPPARSLHLVSRLPAPELIAPHERPQAQLVLGFDIGSTGSKAVAIDASTRDCVWQDYTPTSGSPVDAAQRLAKAFLDSPWASHSLRAVGSTGSGRELVGSLLTVCFGSERVFVLNEIAAHAEGALSYDPRVDTIFEIGGQDAKYVRLDQGRVVDSAMNEACSAGTGSFIEEQGRRFSGVDGVVQLNALALQAEAAVSLGQHCSVFMAEIIDEAVAAGLARETVIAGIYESIIQNYLNRVKGSRSVGQVIFCQGMPFASDALAAAVARQTGAQVIVPPHPGTIGALGIARLCAHALEVELEQGDELDLHRFLEARVVAKDHFVCRSTKGCGEPGNLCKIERLRCVVQGQTQRFCWGGGCALYEQEEAWVTSQDEQDESELPKAPKARRRWRKKLPDKAPDPFRQRDELLDALLAALPANPSGIKVALSDEFTLKGLFPFFATLLAELGCRLSVLRHADQAVLKRGIEECNIPFCAPMQLFHGVVASQFDGAPDLLFLPMLLSIDPVKQENRSVLCPMVQAAPDLNRWDLHNRAIHTELFSPVLDIQSGGLHSAVFVRDCEAIRERFGADQARWQRAFDTAVAAQARFDQELLQLGRQALSYAQEHDLRPIVVLGRSYTIHNDVLNSNVPRILREQGAIAIPIDAYPVDEDVPLFEDLYWGYSQRNLRAAHQIRRTPGVYAVWCSNYACGPDSFSLHLFSYVMQGKPHAVIETDGHAGDAGTRTRIEAFLYCVQEDVQNPKAGLEAAQLRELERRKAALADIRSRGETVLIPRLGPGARALAAGLRGVGIPAESLPLPDRESLALGRRYTSGKECVPLCLTLGSLLQRVQSADESQHFAFLMPTGRGPCRFGAYNLLHKIVLERLSLDHRVRVWSPSDNGYFEGIPAGIQVLAFCGLMTADLLLAAYHDVAPVEKQQGAALAIYERFAQRLDELMMRGGAGDLSMGRALFEAFSGRLFGCAALLREASAAFRAERQEKAIPTVLMVGEIYVRCDPFSNDFMAEKLIAAGIRVRLAPFHEWLDYQEFINTQVGIPHDLESWASAKVQSFIQYTAQRIICQGMGWPLPHRAQASVEAASSYLRYQLEGEATLTLGSALLEWGEGQLDGVLSVAPLECMPSKIAEAQFVHAAEREGVFSLTLALNGDPIDAEILDNFIFEVQQRFERRRGRAPELAERVPLHERAKRLGREIFRGFPRR
ncbi:MAG: acyl-CoA dehydratase activase-related protein [Myxococcota bacterium]|jgi:predicted CoA-substrate-specific enzyme activase|nr:acyl-CoA dehydratase activase-related protein [Myxococcota bacterium]